MSVPFPLHMWSSYAVLMLLKSGPRDLWLGPEAVPGFCGLLSSQKVPGNMKIAQRDQRNPNSNLHGISLSFDSALFSKCFLTSIDFKKGFQVGKGDCCQNWIIVCCYHGIQMQPRPCHSNYVCLMNIPVPILWLTHSRDTCAIQLCGLEKGKLGNARKRLLQFCLLLDMFTALRGCSLIYNVNYPLVLLLAYRLTYAYTHHDSQCRSITFLLLYFLAHHSQWKKERGCFTFCAFRHFPQINLFFILLFSILLISSASLEINCFQCSALFFKK